MDMKYCLECGAELSPNSAACPKCGAPVQSISNEEANALCAECGAPVHSQPSAAAAMASPTAAYAAAPVKRSFKLGLLIAAVAVVAVIVVVLTVIFAIPKNVDNMSFDFDGFSGSYSGSARGGVPQGEGSWLYKTDSVRISADGKWKSGALYEGTVKVTYNGETVGKISYYKSKWDTDDYKAFCDAADAANFADAFK